MQTVMTADGAVLATELEVADTLWSRFVGLMGRRSLPRGHALWIEPCSQVHTFFCRFAMDVAFVDRQGRVRHVADSMRPWRIGRLVFGARAAVEFPAGTLREAGVGRGSVLNRASGPGPAATPPGPSSGGD